MRFIPFFLLFFVAGPWSYAQSSNPVSDGLTANGTIWAMVRDGNTLYLGGEFTSIGGQVRNHLAAMDITTGQLTSWNPNADNTVFALALNGSTLYVGGNFTNFGSQNRNRIAAFNTADGTATSWNPNVTSGTVRAIAVGGSTVYIGGDFSNAGGQARNRIAALDATTGTATSWNPPGGVSELVRALAISGSTLYVGGDFNVRNGGVYSDEDDNVINGLNYAGDLIDPNFQTIGGQTRNYLAALNTSNGTVTSWNPDPNDYVLSLAVNGSTIYAGGDFRSFDPTGSADSRSGLAAFNATSGNLTAWNPGVNGGVWTLAVSGSAVYAGGTFTSLSPNGGTSITRNRLAALNINTGIPTGWNPNSDGYVFSIAVGTSGVYAGGSFSTIGGVNRSNFASFPITSVDWGGSAGGSWNQTSNWAPGIIPNSSLDVAIASGSPLMDVDYTLPAGKTLTVSGTGALTIAPGKALTVAGTADFGGKSVTFRSDATGTSRLGAVTGTLSNATNVTVERYLPLGRKWRMLTAPLTGSTNRSIFYNWQNNDVVMSGKGVEIWGTGGDANPSNSNSGLALGGGVSMRSYGSGGWANVTNTNSTLLFDNTTNYGYALFATGPYNNGAGVGSPSTAAQNTTLSATGTLITGTHTKTLSANPNAGQYFLVGNPYAAPVYVKDLSGANLTGIFYMWDAAEAGTNQLGKYVGFDRTTGLYAPLTAGIPDSSTRLQSGQAFFARADQAGVNTTITFEEADKALTSSNAMFGNGSLSDLGMLRMTLQLDAGGKSYNADGAVALFHANGNPAIDRFDGSKLMNSGENLFMRRGNVNLMFEHRPEILARDTVFLRLSNMQPQSYRLQLETKDLGITEAYLIDAYAKKETTLSVNGTMDYDFTVTADSLSTGDRFTVVFAKAAAPVVVTPDTDGGDALRIYPNPVRDRLRVAVGASFSGPYTAAVFNAAGVEVWKKSGITAGTKTVDVRTSALKSGVYTLVLTDAKGETRVEKFVRE